MARAKCAHKVQSLSFSAVVCASLLIFQSLGSVPAACSHTAFSVYPTLWTDQIVKGGCQAGGHKGRKQKRAFNALCSGTAFGMFRGFASGMGRADAYFHAAFAGVVVLGFALFAPLTDSMWERSNRGVRSQMTEIHEHGAC
jgi:hypothetical protein